MRHNGSRGRSIRKEQHVFDYDGHRVKRNGVSANHLLNFSLPEREKPPAHAKKKKNGHTRTQMEYLHANYRFVIAPLPKDHVMSSWDLETLTEWNSVEQVRLWHDETNPVTCPICLDTFRAPKITRCGHIFCWPCILRYLSLTDKYWRRCPMCFDPVQKSQLRSVCIEQVALPPKIDTTVTFQFLQRSKSSLFPYVPRTNESQSNTRKRGRRIIPRVDDVDAIFARVLESTHTYLTTLAMEEMRALEALEAECRSCGDTESLPYIEEAMKSTSQRLAAHEATVPKQDLPLSDWGDEVVGTGDKYSFYQLSNGSYVVLHPLNLKCLIQEFGSHANEDAMSTVYHRLPPIIQGRVLDVEHLVMNAENEKRYRFLSHFPRFCDFYLCEIDLQAFISKETTDHFRIELRKREKQRRCKQQAGQVKKGKEEKLVPAQFDRTLFHEFSLEKEGEYWPAPAELNLSETLDGLDLNTNEETVTISYSEEASFARITQESGYYPPLSTSHGTNTTPSEEMWGINVNPLIYTTTPVESSVIPKGKKKGKGRPLFSTNQRRSYR